MTIEDFFTASETENGLANTSRVDELISLLQMHNSSRLHELTLYAKQCTTLVAVLAATVNDACLSRFVELNGLSFWKEWIEEALKCQGVCSSSSEDFINTAFCFLERLPVDKSSCAPEFQSALQVLLKNSNGVEDRARALLESWRNKMSSDVIFEAGNVSSVQDDQQKPSIVTTEDSPKQCACPGASSFDVGCSGEGDCYSGSNACASNLVEIREDCHDVNTNSTTSLLNPVQANSLNVAGERGGNSFESCKGSNSCQGNAELPSSTTCLQEQKTSVDSGNSVADHCDSAILKIDGKLMIVESNSREGSASCNSHSDVLSSIKSMSDPVFPKTMDPKESTSCMRITEEPPIDNTTDNANANPVKSSKIQSMQENVNLPRNISADSSKLGEANPGSVSSFCPKESIRSDNEIEMIYGSFKAKRTGTVTQCGRHKKADGKMPGDMDLKSDMELECGEIDALEVARMVAIEVEREVVDYREPLCSSSPEICSAETNHSDKHTSVGLEQDQMADNLSNDEGSAGTSLSDSESEQKNDSSLIAEKNECEDGHDDQTSKSPNLVPSPEGNDSGIRTNLCRFDLNEDAFANDQSNGLVNLVFPATAPTVEISQSAWPQRNTEIGHSSCASTLKSDSHLFDLNVAVGDGQTSFSSKLGNPVISSGFQDVPGKLPLDLNCLEEPDASQHQASLLRDSVGQIRVQSVPSTSSSRHLSRDFDLNDNPFSLDAAGPSRNNSNDLLTFGIYPNLRPDQPPRPAAGSWMLPQDGKESGYQNPPHYVDGFSLDTFPRVPMMPHSFGYNRPLTWGYSSGVAYGPPLGVADNSMEATAMHQTAVTAFLPPLGVADTTGANVMHQIGATTFGLPSAMVPFQVTLATNHPSSSNVFGCSLFGPSGSSGSSTVESGVESWGFRQFLPPAPSGGMVETQPTTGTTLKRKEPDSGWEPFKFGL